MCALSDVQGQIRQALLTGDAAPLRPLLRVGADGQHRLTVHQRHYTTSLVGALLDRFPGTVWLIGSPLVTEAARQFVGLHPPVRPCIAEYGDGFPAFLAQSPPVRHLQYLRDFAELEYRFGQVALEVDRSPLPAIAMASFDHETLAGALIELQPGLRYWHASWPVDALLTAYLTDSAPERFEMEPGSVYVQLRGARGDVHLDRLSLGEFTFRTTIIAGSPVGKAIDHALTADAGFDAAQGLAGLFVGGLVTGIGVRPIAGVQ